MCYSLYVVVGGDTTLSGKERRRQTIDIEWLRETLTSYIGHLDLTIKDFDVWGHPEDDNPRYGVTLRVRVLGPELPTPDEYIEALKDRFGEEYFTLPDEKRKLPEEYKGAMYLGSVKDRHLGWDDVRSNRLTDVHYFVLDETVLPFDDEWILGSGPRPILHSHENLKFWAKRHGGLERFKRKEKEEDRET